VDLQTFVEDFALSMEDFALSMQLADAQRLQASSRTSRRVYQPGIGPHGEDQTVDLIVAELKREHAE
jgi:hypothetical protein